jgi:hypothetical protein
MVCAHPPDCLGNTYVQLPPLRAGETAVESFVAVPQSNASSVEQEEAMANQMMASSYGQANSNDGASILLQASGRQRTLRVPVNTADWQTVEPGELLASDAMPPVPTTVVRQRMMELAMAPHQRPQTMSHLQQLLAQQRLFH